MATISFTTTFDITTGEFVFTDTSNYAGQGIALADVNGCFQIIAPSGTVIYNNTDFSNANSDIRCSVSLTNQTTIMLPTITGGAIEPGKYVITYSVYNSNADDTYTVKNKYDYDYTSPTVEITQTVDCLSPLFTSVDGTDYVVNGITPTKTEVHTIYFPNGSAGQGSPVVGSTTTVTTSTFYNGTQTTTIESTLSYTFADGLIVTDVVEGSEEVLVDCRDICGIYCCIRSIEQQMADYKCTNKIKYQEYSDLFAKIMGYASLALLAIRCGKSDDVNDYISTLRTLSNCTSDCGCTGDEPSQVTGIGGLVNSVVVDSCGNGVLVTPVTVGNTTTYTVCLSEAFVNLVNSFYNTIVEAGNNITVVDSGVIGTTRTFTVRGQKTLLTEGNNITITQTYQTSGVLVVGTTYTIVTYVATDDFTNVGGTNVTGNVFTATGTTPNSWANGSSLQITGTTTYNIVADGPVVVAGDDSVTVVPSTAVGITTYTVTAFGIQRKFVKEFVTVDIEQNLDISYAEKTACDSFPNACTPEGTDPNNYTDQHVQVWRQNGSVWDLLVHGTGYTCSVNGTTGLTRVVTGNSSGTYRVVILF